MICPSCGEDACPITCDLFKGPTPEELAALEAELEAADRAWWADREMTRGEVLGDMLES